MKKVVMLSAAALLGISSIAVSQAEDAADTAGADVSNTVTVVQTASTDSNATAETATDAAASQTTDQADSGAEADSTTTEDGAAVEMDAPVTATEDAEPIPQDTPQVQKLIALYPKLIARIEPLGKVCFEGEDCDVTVRAAGASADGSPRDGKAVYDAVCHTCHATGLLGSPALGDAGAWGARIGKGKDTLYDHAINGFNAMPAKGGADIPDEEVQNAVDYMIEQAS